MESTSISLQIPPEFIEYIDRRIRIAVAEEIGCTIAKSNKTSTYLTRKDVCVLLNISLPTLSSYCTRGILKAQKVGNRVLFDEQKLKDCIRDKPVKFRNR